MRQLVGLVLLASLLSLMLSSVRSNVIVESRAEAAWVSHVEEHDLQFPSQDEHDMRKKIFMEVDDMIQRHNSDPSNTFTVGHNVYSTLTKEELSERLLGRNPISKRNTLRNSPISNSAFSLQDERDIPDSYDLRTSTSCGQQIPMKDQNPCGCCWAFSAISPVEYANCVANGGTYQLFSEQQLVDCDTVDGGCNGGDPLDAYNWLIKSNKGAVDTADSYPYTAKGGQCNAAAEVGATITSYTLIPYDAQTVVGEMQNALLNYGTLSVCLMVNEKNPKSIDPVTGKSKFYNYAGETVFTDPGCVEDFRGSGRNTNANHCTSIVGWGTINGMDHWIMRNQWGESWGNGGYMYIQRGTNMCGIESEASYVTLQAPPPQPTDEPSPTSSSPAP